jgi:hypothetical protein
VVRYFREFRNCKERDVYFKEWFDFEMKAFGANPGEWFEDLCKRKNIGIEHLISKMPREVKRLFYRHHGGPVTHYDMDQEEYVWKGRDLSYFLMLKNLGPTYRNLEWALIAIKYSIFRPNYNHSFDTFLDHAHAPYNEREYVVFEELWNLTIPSKEYRKNHPEGLENRYNSWATWLVRQNNIKYLKILVQEGVDLKKVAATTRHAWVRDFLKKHGFA